MADQTVKINLILDNQIPSYVKEEFPLVKEFLSQYYISLEEKGSPNDILENLSQYIKIDNLTNLIEYTELTSDVDYFDDIIYVNSTSGFPNSYGLIQINSEIITYTGITSTSFTGCIRGFSGVTSYQNTNKPDSLVFSESEIEIHSKETQVKNLSILFLKEFFKKIKIQLIPGFENRQLSSKINQSTFIKQAKDFYSSKGTDRSFDILFGVLYGEKVQVIKPRDYLFIPSDAQYRITQNLVVKKIEGNPEDLINRTLFQDSDNIFSAASGSITNVQKIQRNGETYYVLSLDYDYNKDIVLSGSIFGKFKIHPTTRLINSINSSSRVLDVDSTVGFPSSGSLIVRNSDGTITKIEYQSKSINQFFECSGIDRVIDSNKLIEFDTYAYGYSGSDNSNIVKVRITGVLSELEKNYFNRYYEPGDMIEIKTPGIQLNEIKTNKWILNISTSFDVKSITLVNNSNFSYSLTTFDSHNCVAGDKIRIISSDGIEIISTIFSIQNSNSFVIRDQGQIDTSKTYIFEKLLSKIGLDDSQDYITNVQNIYTDKESVYVASNSIPTYSENNLNINYRSVVFSGNFNGEILTIPFHGFYTGDSVTYKSKDLQNKLNIPEGIYFVKKIDENQIKLSKSRYNIYKNVFVTIIGNVTNNVLEYTDFSNKSLKPQKLFRKLSSPINDDKNYVTNVGNTGILVNGVEILNYKSKDSVFYGPLEKISVTAQGSQYDVINPPVLTISDTDGSGASGYCEVEGKLERIEILDGGFDYLETPIIKITGGNGINATASPNLIKINHIVEFNSISSAQQVNLTNNTITFSNYHKFRDAEEIIYNTNGQNSIGGLINGSSYYVSVVNAYTVKLHKKLSDAISKLNAIDLISYGVGNHTLTSKFFKKIVGSVTILNSGYSYKNRKTVAVSSGINTASNIITIKNHKYKSGEIISYTPENTAIGGMTTGNYYVTTINEDQFKLSEVGIGTTIQDLYYKNQEFINLTSVGSGKHIFNYPQISLKVVGKTGVSTFSGQDFNASLRPIFRGEIRSVFIENGGIGYGSSEILNYNKQPFFTLNNGSGALLKPIIMNGRLSNVIILNSGSDYNSVPDIQVIGSGKGASVVPTITDGKITDVKIVNQGIGYNSSDTAIQITSAGNGAKFEASIKKWTVNLFKRLLVNRQITEDDGVISKGLNQNFELQYTHLYVPRKLRQITYGESTYIPDLRINDSDKELTSSIHSPIIGWAYDGNPIYGPYGYSSLEGGKVKIMESGYSTTLSSDRPSISLYPEGFFVEDWIYKNTGDLDEHNGRFCITPEFPNGVYAYFSTINSINTESDNVFKNYKEPVFPYFIGNTFKSKPIDYNFNRYSNQEDIDLMNTNLIRNTYFYNFTKNNSSYQFIQDPNKIQKQNTEILSVTSGEIKSIEIVSSGDNYQVNDTIIFDNENTNGDGALAEVSKIYGKEIEKISVASTSISNVEFVPYSDQSSLIGFSNYPHSFQNLDIVSINDISTSTNELKDFYNVGIVSSFYILTNEVPSHSVTGIITYFNVYGDLNYPSIRENDILGIGTEKIKVLNIDKKSSRIRVERNYDSTIGTAHTANTLLVENSRKFVINTNTNKNILRYTYNKELYFNPIESVGIGTISGVGIGTTIYFSNPGVGITQIFIPTKTIYFENHDLNTGDELKYFVNGGTPLSVSTNGVNNFQLSDGQTLYAAKISNDLIGIATSKVGLGSTGSFVGINSSISVDTLYFISIGSGYNHSFKTNYSNVLNGTVTKNKVTVSTGSSHGLKNESNISLRVSSGITTTIVVQYNEFNRRMVVNPRNFSSLDVDTTNNTIQIQNHKLVTGQKIIHTSPSSSGGLENNSIYYVYVVDKNTIKLCSTFLNSTINKPIEIDITSASNGTISLINPPLFAEKNQTLIFDLSDSSLSFIDKFNSYSAFDFNLYSDAFFNSPFYSTSNTNKFEVTRTGKVGISSDANLTLKITDFIQEKLYYNLKPINLNFNKDANKEIISDNENIKNSNSLFILENPLSGNHKIIGIGSTSFIFNIKTSPFEDEYNSSNSKSFYETDSIDTYGPISKINMISIGNNYKKLPGIRRINSKFGNGAILIPESDNIGRIVKTDLQDIGFEYFSDKTLRPEVQLPQILKIDPFSSFKRIGISSVGRNYTIAPQLIVLDGTTKKQVLDVDLRYSLGDSQVTILNNTKGLTDSTPNIIPIYNSNGIAISSISFNNTTKDVSVSLGVSFSSFSDFPFNVGDEVLIEGISVGVGTTAKGYNSSNYNYSLFKITQIDPNIGGSIGTITYNLKNYLIGDEVPGVYDAVNSSGRVTPSKYFPIFDITLEKNNFFEEENIISNSASGISNSWDKKNGYLKVSSSQDFIIGETIVGESSKTEGLIAKIIKFDGSYKIDSSSIVENGWNRETGFLNNSLQRIHDSNYYQYFSYELKSKISYENWNNAVSNLNHTAGFKKFANLIIESEYDKSGISTSQNSGDFTGISDLVSIIDLNCVNDYDLATERTLNIDSKIYSDLIIFKSRVLQDYIESVGNRVLMIDDISQQFNSNPRSTKYSIIDSFELDSARSKKYFIYIKDKITKESQIVIVTLIHNDQNGFLNQYGRVETSFDLGFFDFTISGTRGQLLFYPVKFKANDYDLSFMNYSINDTISGIGTFTLGDTVKIVSDTQTIPVGTTSSTTIVGIASTYRASKVLIQYRSTDNQYFEFDELSILHNNSEIYLSDYGQLTTNLLTSVGSSGIGTYNAYYSGSSINVDVIPNVGLGTTFIVNSIVVSIANTSSIGVSTSKLNTAILDSRITSISSSPTPTSTIISEYSSDYSSSYCIISVEDTTNQQYQLSEIVLTNDDSNSYLTEFGNLNSNINLGSFDSNVSGGKTYLTFTPIENIDVKIRVFQNALRLTDPSVTTTTIDLNSI